MFLNYLKIAFRNLLKNKGFSVINITGLSIGMASAILILLWINHETNYDQFHEKKDRIYEAWHRAEFSGELQCWNTTPKVLAGAMQKDMPEVETTARVNWRNMKLFTVGDKSLMSGGNIVDSTFFRVFSFQPVKGDLETALMNNDGIVLTRTLAMSLFGTEDVLGKIVKIDQDENAIVTAVVEDPPQNTRFNFEYLLPWSNMRKMQGDESNWHNNSIRTYVLLKPNTNLAGVQEKMKTFRVKYVPDEPKWQMFIYPISKWRLYSNFENGKESGGNIVYVRIFAVTAAFILLIACINFMNLSTARSEKRAREVGIRKVAGAMKSNLVAQFIGESILVAGIAGLLALLIVILCLPAFNQLTSKELMIDFTDPAFWGLFIAFILFTGFLAGSYPAFFLSSFRPTSVLKGTFKKSNATVSPRKVLVVTQFSFAIILIMCTIVVRKQLLHAQNRNAGYEKDKLVYHMMNGDLYKNYTLVKNKLLESGIASSVTKTSAPLTQAWRDTWGIEWTGKDPNDKTDFDIFSSDENLAKTAGLQLIHGRDFDLSKYPTDSMGMLINESAMKAMNLKDPIGKEILDGDEKFHVVGVFRDFIIQSPFYPTKPMLIEGAGPNWFNTIHFKLSNSGSVADNIRKAEGIFKKYNPNYPFEFKFIDAEYDAKFTGEKRVATLSWLFSFLTIFISCLGLFGLATYMTATRTKEIGVRKVLGASVTSISGMLSKDFLKLVLISVFIGCPIAWWAMNNWLDNYPYRTSIEWWLCLLTAGIAMLIAVATVSYQAIRAALSNPVKSLRSE